MNQHTATSRPTWDHLRAQVAEAAPALADDLDGALQAAVDAAVDDSLPTTYTVAEVTKKLQLSDHGVRNLIARGEIPGVIRAGRRIRIARRPFDRWLEQGASADGMSVRPPGTATYRSSVAGQGAA